MEGVVDPDDSPGLFVGCRRPPSQRFERCGILAGVGHRQRPAELLVEKQLPSRQPVSPPRLPADPVPGVRAFGNAPNRGHRRHNLISAQVDLLGKPALGVRAAKPACPQPQIGREQNGLLHQVAVVLQVLWGSLRGAHDEAGCALDEAVGPKAPQCFVITVSCGDESKPRS